MKQRQSGKKPQAPLDNMKYLVANWWNWDRKSIFLSVFRIPAMVLMPMVMALIPKLMIDCITNHAPVSQMVLMILALSATIAALSWVEPYLKGKSDIAATNARTRYRIMILDKMMRCDYQNIEGYEGRHKFTQSKVFALSDADSGSQRFYDSVIGFFTNITGIVTYVVMLSSLHPVLLGILCVTCIADFFIMKYRQEVWKWESEKKTHVFMLLDYFYYNADDYAAGKDIRIFSMHKWFFHLIGKAVNGLTQLIAKVTRQNIKVSFLSALSALVREAVTYGFLLSFVLKNQMSVSDFIFYFAIVTGFSSWVLGITAQYQQLESISVQCQRFRDFINMPDLPREGPVQKAKAILPSECAISFYNVSFCYEKEGEKILKNVTIEIKPGEKIAIVGMNGAGKTTCVKLLCGFYQPTEGEIRINGENSLQYEKEDYFDLFSVVFQDFDFIPKSIAVNIALCPEDKIDNLRLQKVLQKAGIWERVCALPNGVHTNMVKQIHEDAVDFSGGEQQKLLLARALYKNSPILILDEPTAALDPIAEQNLYMQYEEFTRGKTSIFISHRLSSTRFCDRILFFENGEITEAGTHEELLKKRGRYWNMYQIQSKYYNVASEEVQRV